MLNFYCLSIRYSGHQKGIKYVQYLSMCYFVSSLKILECLQFLYIYIFSLTFNLPLSTFRMNRINRRITWCIQNGQISSWWRMFVFLQFLGLKSPISTLWSATISFKFAFVFYVFGLFILLVKSFYFFQVRSCCTCCS